MPGPTERPDALEFEPYVIKLSKPLTNFFNFSFSPDFFFQEY